MTKRTKIIIGSILALLVIAAGIIASTMLTKHADDVGAAYRNDLIARLEAIRKGPTMIDRANLVQKPLVLPSAFLGSQLSSTYRDAEALNGRYSSLINNTKTFFEEARTYVQVVDTVKDFTTLVNSSIPIPSEPSEENATKVDAQAKKFGEIATSFESYTFVPTYESNRKKAVEDLRSVQKKFEEVATLLRTKEGNVKPEIQTIATSYAKVYEEIRQFIVGPVTDSVKEQAARLPNQSKEVDGQYKSFIDDLK